MKIQIIAYIHYYIGTDCGFWFILYYTVSTGFLFWSKTSTLHIYSSIGMLQLNYKPNIKLILDVSQFYPECIRSIAQTMC